MFDGKMRTVRYALVSMGSGLLFGVMDGLINTNPMAVTVYEFNLPIRRASVDVLAGILIDIAYGFILAAVFVLLYRSLPGRAGITKGASFGFLVWFFRGVMSAASQWVTLNMPTSALLYGVVTGLGETLALGLLYGATLRPLT